MNKFIWPDDDEHTAIMGRTGSGKTVMGGYVLSRKNFQTDTWVMIDYKGDDLLNSITRAREIDYNIVPQQPGLYILHATLDDEDLMEGWLRRVWAVGNIGLYADEGYMLPKGGGYRNILTQGRSKRIPTITLSQRPIEIDRFTFSEASHVVVFHLNDRRDIKTVREFTPEGFMEWIPPQFGTVPRLPDRHARWYNIKSDSRFVLKPVPPPEEIVSSIDGQLEPKKRWL
jgi:hypothetical protein